MSSLLHLFAQPEPPHRLIAPSSRLTGARSARVMSLFMALFGLFLFCVLMIFQIANNIVVGLPYLAASGPFLFPWYMLFLPIMMFFQVISYSVQMRYWQNIEPWRFVASLGNERLFADEQPEPRATALPLPTTIKVNRMTERHFSIRYLAFFVICIAAYIFAACTMLLPSFGLLWLWSLPITALFIGLLLLGMFFMLRVRYPMEITEDGIRVRSTPGGFTTLIFWHELRLFACYPEPGVKNGDEAMVYELSSGSQVIYWTWMRKKSLLNTIMGPSMSLEEHNLQMQALCSLISAKTGLPLYDLSKGQALRLEETAETR